MTVIATATTTGVHDLGAGDVLARAAAAEQAERGSGP
jgi:hypothetical protein